MKTLKIDEKIHALIKDYCNKNNLKMGKFIESLLKKYVENNDNNKNG